MYVIFMHVVCVCVHVHVYVHVHLHVHIDMYMCIYLYACVCICMCICIYIYTCVCVRMYMYEAESDFKTFCENHLEDMPEQLVKDLTAAIEMSLSTECEALVVHALRAEPKKSKMQLHQHVKAQKAKLENHGGFSRFHPTIAQRCSKALSFD